MCSLSADGVLVQPVRLLASQIDPPFEGRLVLPGGFVEPEELASAAAVLTFKYENETTSAVLSRRTLLAASLAVLASPTHVGAIAPVDGTYTAVVDRFEAAPQGRLAVLLLEAVGESRDRLLVPGDNLPSRARHQDAVLEVVVRDGELSRARYLPEETRARAEAAQARFDRLAHGDCVED